MADVTGPISTLAGTRHALPDGTMCDEHPDRPAVARIQGETDSFGCEMHDCCQECLDEIRAYARSAEARTGQCDWCKQQATDLRGRRDYDEGLYGRVYRVCGACAKRSDERIAEEAREYEDDRYDWDDDCDDTELLPRGIHESQDGPSAYIDGEYVPLRTAPLVEVRRRKRVETL